MAKGNEAPVIQVPISAILYREIERRIAGTEFPSVEAYVAYVLQELMMNDEGEALSAEEEQVIKERLRALGYLD